VSNNIFYTQSIPNCKSFDFFNIKFDHSSYSKFCKKYHFFLLCIGLLIKVLQEWLKFDNICINFLNKTSGQTWGKKSQTTYNLGWREYFSKLPTIIRKVHKNFQINCLIRLFIKNHKLLAHKHFIHHKSFHTANIVFLIFFPATKQSYKAIKTRTTFFWYIFYFLCIF